MPGIIAPSPAALLVGDPASGKFCLTRALVGRDVHKSHDREYRLHLDNKYYTADVAVHAASPRHPLLPEDLEDCQALVLVVDATQEASFAAVQAWHASNDSDHIEVRLLVVTKADAVGGAAVAAGAGGAPAWLRGVQAWCVEHMLEYIITAAAVPEVDAALELDGEGQGVARVLAALSAHQWPGLVLKSRRGGGGGGGHAPSTPSQQQEQQRRQQQQQQQQLQQHDAAPEAASDAEPRTTAANASGRATVSSQEAEAEHLPGTWLRMGSEEGDPVEDEAAAEQSVDMFEQLLSQVASARARSGSAPDAERREAAATLAYQLAAMLGLEEEPSEADDTDEGSEQGGEAAGNGHAGSVVPAGAPPTGAAGQWQAAARHGAGG